MTKSKKAMILYYIIIPGFIIGLITFYVYSLNRIPQTTNFVGETEFYAIQWSQEAEKALMFVDVAAKLSAQQAAHKLANEGGFVTTKCGMSGEYYIWKETCLPDFNLNYKIMFTSMFNEYIKQLKNTVPSAQLNNHEISLIETDTLNVIGIAETPLIFTNRPPADKDPADIQYTEYPSFDVQINYRLSESEQIISDALALIKECKQKMEIDSCIEANKPKKFGYCAERSSSPGVINFCVNSDYSLPFYDKTTNKLIDKPVEYKFALSFN